IVMYYWYKKKWFGKSVVDKKDALDLDEETEESLEPVADVEPADSELLVASEPEVDSEPIVASEPVPATGSARG
ncbi:MAG: hypothetical protein J6Y58_07085, partial [Clostridiales bacterium]|nr:hypothetical protein [Clostridiales bacterium]